MPKPVSVTFECENCGQFFEVPVWNEITRDVGYIALNLDCEDEVYCESCLPFDEYDDNIGEEDDM